MTPSAYLPSSLAFGTCGCPTRQTPVMSQCRAGPSQVRHWVCCHAPQALVEVAVIRGMTLWRCSGCRLPVSSGSLPLPISSQDSSTTSEQAADSRVARLMAAHARAKLLQ